MFTNREEAANLLAQKLVTYKNNKDVVIVAIPRGGVPLGSVIAGYLHAPLEVVLSKKIGHPFHKEFAIGAVTLNSRILEAVAADVPDIYIKEETERIRTLLKQRYTSYYGKKLPLNLHNKIVILIDDGVATGNTLISCIELIDQQKPKHIIVALPVGPLETIKKIKALPIVNKTICLLTPKDFYAVGQFYNEFDQVSDDEVIALLEAANTNYISTHSKI